MSDITKDCIIDPKNNEIIHSFDCLLDRVDKLRVHKDAVPIVLNEDEFR